jgi:hypothetical protein
MIRRIGVYTAVLLLGWCSLAEAATFCAKSGNELNAALYAAAGNGDDDVVKVTTGTHTTDYHAPGTYQWQYPI